MTQDDHFQTHFIEMPRRIFDVLDTHLPEGGTIVDFGCGMGIKTIAAAVTYPHCRVVGVDRTDAFKKAGGFVAKYLDGKWPGNLDFVELAEGQALADVARPDAIVSWAVLEHVNRSLLPGVIAGMRAALRPGGIVVNQIAPLFYSPFGSHLRAFDPEPWAHLIHSHDDFRHRVVGEPVAGGVPLGSAQWMFARYEELNRLTASELFDLFAETGFSALLEDTKQVRYPIPPVLARVYDETALRAYELFSVHRAADRVGPADATEPRRLRWPLRRFDR